jgi:tRNA threonylcarbamoyl adenosine modification protein YjeE
MKLTLTSAEQMEKLGERLATLLRPGDLVLLSGPLGAGKTTLTRGLGEGLKAEGTIQSPTFVLARTHRLPVGKLVHVDAYRLSSAIELDDLDIDFANSIVVVEWARDYLAGFAESYLSVEISRGEEEEVRSVEVKAIGPRWEGVSLAAIN